MTGKAVSHWGTEREIEAVTKEVKKGGWQLSVNQKKSGKHRSERKEGGYEMGRETGRRTKE